MRSEQRGELVGVSTSWLLCDSDMVVSSTLSRVVR